MPEAEAWLASKDRELAPVWYWVGREINGSGSQALEPKNGGGNRAAAEKL